jgi:predicted HAD superfamily Cof-like phosphohydrolase
VKYTLTLVVEQGTNRDPASQMEFDLGLPPKVHIRRSRKPRLNEVETYVAEFHHAFGLPLEARPQRRIAESLAQLRVDLLTEEVEEFIDAVARVDTVAVADALADIVYVAYGSALSWGIDLDAVIREVHRANMSKLGPDGRPIMREDGKVLKSASYTPPDVRRVLLDQPPLFLDLGDEADDD